MLLLLMFLLFFPPPELLVELAETSLILQESYSEVTNFTVIPPRGGLAIPVTFVITFVDIDAIGGQKYYDKKSAQYFSYSPS